MSDLSVRNEFVLNLVLNIMRNKEIKNTENAKRSDHEIVEEDPYNILEKRKNVATEDARISNSAQIRNLKQKLQDKVIEIKETVRQVGTVPTTQCFIYRTPQHVRSLNEAAYTPRVVSIGPYHHGRYRSTEELKKRYCMELIERTNKMSLEIISSGMTTYERLLRDSYKDADKIESDILLAMVLIDGCFILEYMLKSCYDKDTSQDINYNHDILLQENQIPFEILKFLFKSTAPIPTVEKELSKGNVVPREIFKEIKKYKKDCVSTREEVTVPPVTFSNAPPPRGKIKAHIFNEIFKKDCVSKHEEVAVPPVTFSNAPPPRGKIKSRIFMDIFKGAGHGRSTAHNKDDDVWDKILVLLVMEFFRGINTNNEDSKDPEVSEVMHITDLIRKLHEPKNQTPDPKYIDSKFTATATQLHEAGVKFKAISGKGLLDIEFKNRCLEIPIFEINENRLSLYRNLMVLEFLHYPSNTFITDYFVFMDTLIDSSDDVKLLVKNGVLFNKLGHYSDTANIFNNFCGGIHPKSGTSYLMRICADLNAYYKEPSNVWWTTFKRDYFGTPIRAASSLGALTLIVLTFISTVYAILAYNKPA